MIDRTNSLQVYAATIWGEARGETLEGKQAVASVILNRAAIAANTRRPQFGDGSIESACLAAYQFSCWNSRDPNRPLIENLNFDLPDPILQGCISVAKQGIDGTLDDPTNGCTFYKTTVTPWPATWGTEVDPVVTIGHQQFYKLA